MSDGFRMAVELWTDGSGTTSGPFAWAWVLRARGAGGWVERHGGGFGCDGTNNRAELMGVLDGLRQLKRSSTVRLFTDSEYVGRSIRDGLVREWRAKGWHKRTGGLVANIDLWEQIADLLDRHEVVATHVEGHAGVDLNERCDRIAGAARKLLKAELDAIATVPA